MKLTVVDIESDSLFGRADFSSLRNFRDIELLSLPPTEPLDGSIFRSLPSDTTHLVTRLADRLGYGELTVLKDLKYVGLAYTGWWDKYFDCEALRRRNIAVTNNPDYAPNAVAEAVFACVLGEYRKLAELRIGDASQRSPIGRELRGKSFGVLGMGHIGQAVASIATGVGMNVLSCSKNCPPSAHSVSRGELITTSDVLGIFVPKSAGINLGSNDFSSLKADVVIVNPSGHENVDTDALARFLRDNPGAAYAYLAMPDEEHFHRLSGVPNAKLFPLFSSNTVEARQRRKEGTLANLHRFLQGEISENRVI